MGLMMLWVGVVTNVPRLMLMILNTASNYKFKVNNRNTRGRYEIYSKLTIKTPEQR